MSIFSIGKGEETKPKIHSDPFNVSSFERANIFIYRSYPDTTKLTYTGNIKFKNGQTEGTQNFEANSLSELTEKMDVFMKTLS